nr:PREDICTED: caricain-like [Bemisia tabaci]
MITRCSTIFFLRLILWMAELEFTFKKVVAKSSGETEDLSVTEQFERFIVEHGKFYDSVEEKMRRLEIFRDNLRLIEELNADETNTAVFGVTPMADLTHAWLLRNSWGTKWGVEGGHFYVKKGFCGIGIESYKLVP